MFRKFSIIAITGLFLSLCIFQFPHTLLAHENYVLTAEQMETGMTDWSINVWDAAKNPENLAIGLKVGAGIFLAFLIYFFLLVSRFERFLDRTLGRFESWGGVLVRIALGFSFIYSAMTSVYLGPEIPITSLPLGFIIQWLLYIVGALLLLGFLSEIAGIISFIIICLATFVYKDYMITYFNYFGEFIAIAFFGSRFFSVDKLIWGVKKSVEKLQEWENLIVRVAYGISVLYPAFTIKILHPIIMIEIVEKYRLNEITWLFPSDPLLISLGTGLAQILVGICIIIGFETRLTSLATFALYVMSIVYFKEVVWPHYILLALSLYFVINGGGKYTVDTWIKEKWSRWQMQRHSNRGIA